MSIPERDRILKVIKEYYQSVYKREELFLRPGLARVLKREAVRCMEQGVGFVTLPRPLTTMSYGGISTRLHQRKWLADQWLASRKFGRGRLGAMLLFGRIFAMYLGRRARGLCAKLGLTGRRRRSRT